jgi:hypothetical protein
MYGILTGAYPTLQEPQKTTPDAFFGIFSAFLEMYESAVAENKALKEKEESATKYACGTLCGCQCTSFSWPLTC